MLIIIIRCVSNTLVFWKNPEEFDLFLGFPPLVISARRFLEEATKLPDIFQPFPHKLDRCPIRFPQGYLLFSLGARLYERSSSGASVESCVSFIYLFSWGISKVLGGNISRLQEIY